MGAGSIFFLMGVTAVFSGYVGWVLRGMRPILQDHVLADEAHRLKTEIARLEESLPLTAAALEQLSPDERERLGIMLFKPWKPNGLID